MKFIGEVHITPLNKREFKLVASFALDTEQYGRIYVPAGFRTDLASIPRIIWNIFPPFGRYTKSAIVHDYLYYSNRNGGSINSISRKEADLIFHDAMILEGVPSAKAKLFYYAVRLGGSGGWSPINLNDI